MSRLLSISLRSLSVLALLLLVVFYRGDAYAYSCGIDWNLKKAVKGADLVFVARITAVTLDDERMNQLVLDAADVDYSSEIDYDLVINFYDYDVIEYVKGNAEDKPILLTAIGVGLGTPKLFPGGYYLISLSITEENKVNGRVYSYLSYCDIHSGAATLKDEKLRSEIKKAKVIASG